MDRELISRVSLQSYKLKKYELCINVETSKGFRELIDIDKVTSSRIRVGLKPSKEVVRGKEKNKKLFGYQLFDFDPSEFKWDYIGHNRHYLDSEMLASIRFDKEIERGSFKPMPKKYEPILFDPSVEKFTSYFTAPIKCEVEIDNKRDRDSLEADFVPLVKKLPLTPFSGFIKLTFEIHPKSYKVHVTLHESK